MAHAPLAANAVDTAYHHLRGQVLSGELGPGERIREIDVADATGISRTPVREALRRLSSEGLVELTANKGARVAFLDLTDVTEMYALRLLIEPYAAGQAVLRATTDQIYAMKVASEQMKALVAAKREGWARKLTVLNYDFHTQVLEASGNRRVIALGQSLMDPGLINSTFETYAPDELHRSCVHHDELIAAIESGNASWASAVMVAHLAAGMEVARRARLDTTDELRVRAPSNGDRTTKPRSTTRR